MVQVSAAAFFISYFVSYFAELFTEQNTDKVSKIFLLTWINQSWFILQIWQLAYTQWHVYFASLGLWDCVSSDILVLSLYVVTWMVKLHWSLHVFSVQVSFYPADDLQASIISCLMLFYLLIFVSWNFLMNIVSYQATSYESQYYSMPVPSQDKLGGLWQKGHSV